ncbi:MAG: carboxypeptidase regulatory-like domain-containing protein [Pirellulales bacterium]|nr:carboxypeptidase regulatory-like domain-containing protein [Pirellulales bacterium]
MKASKLVARRGGSRWFWVFTFAGAVWVACLSWGQAMAEDPAAALPNTTQLSGRITDETGAPVTDATVFLDGNAQSTGGLRNNFQAATDADGRYSFADLEMEDIYRLRIESKKWVGLTDWRNLPQLQLSPLSNVERDFTLRRACQIRIRTVDEAGNPVADTRVYFKSLAGERFSSSESATTKDDGWATIGGLAPSEIPYLFGTHSENHAFGKLTTKLNDPASLPEKKIVLKKGTSVTGVVMCSDGKPAAGWSVTALPDWWSFGVHPDNAKIEPDGTFKLQHVSEEKYDLSVSVPIGESMSRSESLANSIRLVPVGQPLKFTLKTPSPESMVAISGELKFTGVRPKERLWLEASRPGSLHSFSMSLEPGETKFRLAPMPPGVYTISVQSSEIEHVEIPNIAAPAKGVVVPVKVVERLQLMGTVTDDEGGPVTRFRLRVRKFSSLRGPNYSQDSQWRDVDSVAGDFSVELVGPGVYRADVEAEGFASASSELVNTDKIGSEPITIRLTRGVELRGNVLDEQGQPVDGAEVTPYYLPQSEVGLVSANRVAIVGEKFRSTKSSKGEYRLSDAHPGKVALRVTHPEYCYAVSEVLEVGSDNVSAGDIVLTRGCTVRGTVYDAEGKPLPNASLMFREDEAYRGYEGEDAGLLANVATDVKGNYEVHALPSQLCYVARPNNWDVEGVACAAVLPANGEVRKLDLGGPQAVTGRITLNGQPLADTRIQLGGEQSSSSMFRAYWQTDAEGRFAIARPPVGRYTLWRFFSNGERGDWAQVGIVTVHDTTNDLGTIESRSANLDVTVEGVEPAELAKCHAYLSKKDNTWFSGGRSFHSVSAGTGENPIYSFRSVPLGNYDLQLNRPDGCTMKWEIEITGKEELQTAAVAWPAERGTLVVNVPAEMLNPPTILPQFRNVAGTVFGYLGGAQGEGKIRRQHLPAGDYYVTDEGVLEARHLLDFKISAGKTTTLDLNSEILKAPRRQRGIAMVQCFNEQGIPLPGCKLNVRGPSEPERVSEHDGQHHVVAEPGKYTVEATFDGFLPTKQEIEIAAPTAEGRVVGSNPINLLLRRKP